MGKLGYPQSRYYDQSVLLSAYFAAIPISGFRVKGLVFSS